MVGLVIAEEEAREVGEGRYPLFCLNDRTGATASQNKDHASPHLLQLGVAI